MIPGTLIIEITYIIAVVLFILSLKWLSSPATARRGVWAGEVGMVLAIAGTLLYRGIVDYKWIAIALVLGAIIGVPLGNVQMTAVPQRTALSHAFGALCVTLVGTAEFYLRAPNVQPFMMSVLSLEVILGGLTITGSLMAAGKLQEVLPQRPITYKGQNFVNLGMLLVAIGIAVRLVLHPADMHLYPFMVGIALLFGVMMIVPIGAAEFLCRTFGCCHGLRAQQQTADRRRLARWSFRLYSVSQHVEGDEPLILQCSVWGLWAGTDGGSGRGGDAQRTQRHSRRSGVNSLGGE